MPPLSTKHCCCILVQVATERMIERLEQEGGYNDDFLAEFRTFRGELRDFFNASSFTDMLDILKPSLDEPDVQVMAPRTCFACAKLASAEQW